MTKKLAFLVNSERCLGCQTCTNACKNNYQYDPYMRWRKVYEAADDAFGHPLRAYASLACNHCEDPACLKACPVHAYTKLDNGIVFHDNQKCIGCKMCVMACPYHVPTYSVKLKVVQKCNMCNDRVEVGEKTFCEQACPVGAIKVVDRDSDEYKKAQKTMPGFIDEGTHPSTRFIRPRVGKQIKRSDI